MLIGTSGAFLVYSWHFESWLNPSLRRAETSVKDYDLGQVISAAALAMESQSLPQSFRAPDGDALNVAVTFAKPLDGEDKPEVRTAFVDPSTATYRGQIDPDKTVSEFLFDFHHELFLGRTGKTIVAVCGILILILFGTGFYLWWPKRRFIVRSLRFPRFRTPYQFLYDWHKLWGVYTFALMIMMVGTGIYIAQPQWFEGPKEKKDGAKKPFVALPLDAINFQDLARELAAKDIPLRPLRLQLNAEKQLLTIRTKFPDGSNRRLTYDISQKTFEEVDLKAAPVERKAFLHDLHEGKYWNGKGSVLSFLAGLTTIALFLSGFFIWWGRPSRRKLRKNP